MRPLLIIGAGSFSVEVDELSRLNGYNSTFFLDDNPLKARSTPVIGKLEDIEKVCSDFSEAIVAFGNNELRIKYHNKLRVLGMSIPMLIHPTAYVSPDSTISPGCIVRTKAVVSRYATLGEACIVNVGAMIDHDCIIEEGCHILMGAVIRNKVHLPAKTWVPSNAVIE